MSREEDKRRLLSLRANIPKLRTSELANIPERPQFNLSDAYRAAMSAPTAQHKGVLVEGSSSVSASSPRRHVALPSARRRMRELQNGKTQLQATHVNFNPTFREAKPLALSSDASAAAALRRPSGGPAASSSGPGEDDGADNNKLLKGLMMMLNSDNLADMKREFGKYKERGFDVAEFVDVMVRQLTRSSFGAGTAEEREEERAEREALVAKLAELFTQVDVNGDGSMEWSELTSYIVESHAKPEPPMPEFHAVPPLLDQSRLKSGQRIERVFYVAPLDLVLLCEAPQSVVSVYSPRQAACLHELRGHRAEVLAVEYVAVAGCLVTSGADLALCWWDTSGKEEHRSWKLRQRAPLPTCQQALRWSGQASLLFSGGDDGYILGWDMSTLECVVTLHAHKQAVTSMILLSEATDLHKKAELLATASLDGSVRLWNVAQRKDGKCAPREMHVLLGHERGVTCLAFVPAHKLLFSAGLDHALLAWNPLSETLICPMRGHVAPIVHVEATGRTAQLCSVDAAGALIVWDMRALVATQQLQLSLQGPYKVTALAALPPYRQLLVAARRLSCFQGPEEDDSSLTDPHPLAGGLYNRAARSFVTAAGRDVLTWDAESGKLTNRLANVTPTPITAMCLDDRERKLMLADSSGTILVLNYANGTLMKRLTAHKGEVSALLYNPLRRHVISTSWDRMLQLHDESLPDEAPLLRCVASGHTCDVTCAAFAPRMQLFATGGDDGSLQLWRLDALGQPHPLHRLQKAAAVEGVGCEQGYTEEGTPKGWCITALCFLEPYPLLAAADAAGDVVVHSLQLGGPLTRWKQLLLLRNLSSAVLRAASFARVAKVQFSGRNADGTDSLPGSLVPYTDAYPVPPVAERRPSPSTPRERRPSREQQAERRPSRDRRTSARPPVPPGARASSCAPTPPTSARAATGLQVASDAGPGATAQGSRGGRLSSPRAVALATDSSTAQQRAAERIAAAAAEEEIRRAAAPSTAPPAVTVAACAVTALAYSPERGTLTWGDDVGRMVIWDLSRLLNVIKQSQQNQRPPQQPVKPSEKEAEVKGRGWLAARLHGLEVQMVKDWKAHAECITSLHAIAEPASIFSCSADRLAKVWRHDGAACFGTLRRRRRPDEKADQWRFPVDGQTHRKQMMEQAAVISQRLDSEAFRSRQDSLSSPPPSESAFSDDLPLHQRPTWAYEPGAGAELCADVWRRLRSKKGAAAKPDADADADADGATFLTAQPGDEAMHGEDAEAGEAATDEASVGDEAADAAKAVLLEAAEATEAAEVVGAAETAAAGTAEASAAAEEPDSTEAGAGDDDAAAASAAPDAPAGTPPRTALFNPPVRTFAEGTSVDSVAAARLDDALAGT